MKKFLLPEQGNLYKANLHCHSTCSDGKLSPKELKEAYMEKGYSIIAYTDHNVFVCHHQELSDDNFLALNGCEINFCETNPDGTDMDFEDKRSTHIGIIAKDPKNKKIPIYHRSKYDKYTKARNLPEPEFYEEDEDFEREYSVDCVNAAIKKAKDRGFFVIYNHPTWSLDGYAQYSGYTGFDAMEMFNYHSYLRGFPEYNSRVYDDLLRQNKRIGCIAADDNHNGKFNDSFGGFTVFKADDLNYKTIINALEAGHYYSSFGPIIKSLWYEDKKICVECGPCQSISFTTGITLSNKVKATDTEELTYAEFPLDPTYKYVRVTVTGKRGTKANTRAYFLDELMSEEDE